MGGKGANIMSLTITNRTALLAIGILALTAAAGADDLALKVNANRGQVYLGESFILEITLSGSSQAAEPDLSRIKNCRIKPLGSQNISHYSITIVNGRPKKEGFFGRISSYEITPTAAGTLQVGPVSVSVEGRTLAAPGPVVTVTDIEKQDLVLISVTASHETVLIDEPFDVTLRVLIRQLPDKYANVEPLFTDNPPDLTIPYLSGEGLEGLTLPDIQRILQERLVADPNRPGLAINGLTLAADPFDFTSFFHGATGQPRKARFALNRRLTSQDGKAYIEYSLTLNFIPKDEGNYVFGPVVFKGSVPVEVSAQGQARGTPVFAVGPAGTVRVVPPPEEGRPTSFTGALGTNLAVTAALDTATANIGDPLKLTLTLSGQVRFDKMLPPKLSLQTNILERFSVYDNTVQTVKGNNQRQYLYTLRPTEAGSFDLPPIEVSFYDTKSRSYRTLATPPLPLVIKRGAEITATQIEGPTNLPPERKKEFNLAAEPPAPIRADPAGADPAALMGGSWTLAAGAAGPAMYLLVLLGGLVRQHSGAWKLAARRRRALPAARRHLGAARRSTESDPNRAGREIRAAICGYLAGRLGAPAGITPADARQCLETAAVSPAAIEELTAIFERHFNAGFSNQAPPLNLAADLRRAQNVLEQIDRETRTRKTWPTEHTE